MIRIQAKFRRAFLALLVFAAIPVATSAPVERPYARGWNLQSGLVNEQVYSIAEDIYQRIWVATPNGLNVIDGLGVISLQKGERRGNLSSNVTTRIVAVNEEMWVLSLNGIDRINVDTMAVNPIEDPDGLLSRATNMVIISPELALVVASQRLIELNLKDFTLKKSEILPSDTRTSSIFSLGSARVLLPTESDYFIYDLSANKLEQLQLNGIDVTQEDIRASYYENDKLWISIFGKGIYVFKSGNLIARYNRETQTLRSNMVSKIFRSGKYIYAITRRGVDVFEPQSLRRSRSIVPDSQDNVYANANMALTATFHSDGSLLIGTTNGLFRIPAKSEALQSVHSLAQSQGLSLQKPFFVNHIFNDNGQAVLIGNQQSIALDTSDSQRIQLQPFDKPGEWQTNMGNISVLSDNRLWQYQGGDFVELQVHGVDHSKPIKGAFSLHKNDWYVLVTNQYLFLAKRNGFDLQVISRKYLGSALVVDMVLVGDSLYIATQRKGILMLSLSQWQLGQAAVQTVSGPKVPIDLYLDRENTLWALTFDEGVFFRNFDRQMQGFLPYQFPQIGDEFNPVCITEDNQGRYWFAGNMGITAFNPGKNTVQSFELETQLPMQSFVRYQCGASGDFLYFGSDQDIVLVQPEQVNIEENQQSLSFHQVRVDNKAIKLNGKSDFIEPSLLSFSLISSDFLLGKDDKLLYRVLFSEEKASSSDLWRETLDRNITLIKPNTGNYLIQAKVKKFDGSETDVVSTAFTIQVPFPRSPLMLSLYVASLLIMLTLIFVYKLRLKNTQLKVVEIRAKQQQAYSEELAQQVAEKTEQYKVQRQKAIKANLDKTRFIASASHDLRAPLNAVRWQLETLLEDNSADKTRIMEEIVLLDKLVESIVNLSKFDANMIKPSIVSFCINDLVEETCKRFERSSQDAKVNINFQNGDEYWVQSDRFLMARVINNLVDNAIKNLPPDGNVDIVLQPMDDRLSLAIRDNGPGIESSLQSRLFESFTRGTEKYSGSGLGLTIVKQICELLDVPLTLMSDEQGTQFTLAIPFGKKQSLTLENAGVKKAVLIDDDPFYVNELSQLLAKFGFDIDVIQVSDESNLSALQGHYQLLVCDYNLGLRQPGIYWLEKALTAGALMAEQVIIVSEDKSVREEAMGHDGWHFLSKPIKKSRLSWVLQQGELKRDGE